MRLLKLLAAKNKHKQKLLTQPLPRSGARKFFLNIGLTQGVSGGSGTELVEPGESTNGP